MSFHICSSSGYYYSMTDLREAEYNQSKVNGGISIKALNGCLTLKCRVGMVIGSRGWECIRFYYNRHNKCQTQMCSGMVGYYSRTLNVSLRCWVSQDLFNPARGAFSPPAGQKWIEKGHHHLSQYVQFMTHLGPPPLTCVTHHNSRVLVILVQSLFSPPSLVYCWDLVYACCQVFLKLRSVRVALFRPAQRIHSRCVENDSRGQRTCGLAHAAQHLIYQLLGRGVDTEGFRGRPDLEHVGCCCFHAGRCFCFISKICLFLVLCFPFDGACHRQKRKLVSPWKIL